MPRTPRRSRLTGTPGYSFTSPVILDRALTHSSPIPEVRAALLVGAAKDAALAKYNERWSVLGDAVRIAGQLSSCFTNFPNGPRALSKRPRRAWSTRVFLEWRRAGCSLANTCGWTVGTQQRACAKSHTLLADAFEAIVLRRLPGCGLGSAAELLKRALFEHALLEDGDALRKSDRKSCVAGILQWRWGRRRRVRPAGSTGPDHHKVFRWMFGLVAVAWRTATEHKERGGQRRRSSALIRWSRLSNESGGF